MDDDSLWVAFLFNGIEPGSRRAGVLAIAVAANG